MTCVQKNKKMDDFRQWFPMVTSVLLVAFAFSPQINPGQDKAIMPLVTKLLDL
jgi:hypothetical protein